MECHPLQLVSNSGGRRALHGETSVRGITAKLLVKAGIDAESVRIMVVVEFSVHRGRVYLRQRGLYKVSIQSTLLFGGPREMDGMDYKGLDLMKKFSHGQ